MKLTGCTILNQAFMGGLGATLHKKENSSVVEQASCLSITEVQKENSSVVEQASCLFITEVQDLS
ncbi:hypothetical protein [Microcoleus vaginatus]|uniref:hypothetical protein n=1 Tax=Microcoleus vaginatus TaxID=119532 RepID=UPI001F602249|nr:hypothetical protein D0A37_06835 [Microcoleus vaginatus HSN003]